MTRAQLNVYCPNDPGALLMALYTDTGHVGQALMVPTGNWTSEFIGEWVPTDLELREHGLSRESVAVAKPRPGQAQHFRFHLRCPRPLCTYHAEFGQDAMEQLHYVVERMHASGGGEVTIDGLDAWLREIARLKPDISARWVSLRHPGTGSRHRVPNNPGVPEHFEARGWVREDK